MNKSTLLSKIEEATIDFLKERNADDPSRAVLLPDIIVKLNHNQSDPISENTISAYMSRLASSGESFIKSAGKKKGFYYHILEDLNDRNDDSSNRSEEATAILSLNSLQSAVEVPEEVIPARALIEKKLYILIKDWLLAEDFNASITADKTGNGKWGNPDITGIKITGSVTESKEVEIITIEAKPNLLQWKQFIFEAISHTRFANTSYYCFAYPENERNSLDPEIYLYAEEFGLGLLGIEMVQEDYDKFLANKYDPKFEDVYLVELQTPRYKTLRPYFREKFFKSLNINNLKELILWGEKPQG